MKPRTEAEEFEYWNKLLAKEGLTVDRGRFPTGKRVSLQALESEDRDEVSDDIPTKTFNGRTTRAYREWTRMKQCDEESHE